MVLSHFLFMELIPGSGERLLAKYETIDLAQ